MTAVRRTGSLALVGLCALFSLTAQAQGVYRIVGPDGKVTFSDRPPPDAKATPAPSVNMPANNAGGGALPFELRGIASRYPVTIYTGKDCGPCDGGRNYLRSRGIPFNERTINNDNDVEALMRLAGAPRLPVLTIGGQQLKGFSEVEWGQYLDAAGYPKTSALPAAYRNPPPTPLVAVQAAPRTPIDQAPQPGAQAEAPAAAPAEAPAPSNPAGIRF